MDGYCTSPARNTLAATRLTPSFLPQQHYYKAYAYRVEPADSKGWLSVDGEAFPLEPYEVEVRPGLGTLLSMYGCYQLDFDLPKKGKQPAPRPQAAP